MKNKVEKLRMTCTIDLPCNVGDTLYTNLSVSGWYLRNKDKPYSVKVVFIGINGVDNFFNVEYGKGKMWQFKESDFGKRVFSTKEEAISKLKEIKDNE